MAAVPDAVVTLMSLNTFKKIQEYVDKNFGAPDRTRMLGRLVENQGLDNWMTHELMDAAVLNVAKNFREVVNVPKNMTRDQATSTTADKNHLGLEGKAVDKFFNFQTIRVDQDAKACMRHVNRPDGMFHLKIKNQSMVLFYEGDAHERDAGKSPYTAQGIGNGCMNSHKMYQYIAQSHAKNVNASACTVIAALVHVPTDDFVVFLDEMLKAHIFVCIAIAQHNQSKFDNGRLKTALEDYMGLARTAPYDFVIGINIQSTDHNQALDLAPWRCRVDQMLGKLNQGAAGGPVNITLRPLLSDDSTGNVNFSDYTMGSLAIALCAIPRPAENILETGLLGALPKFTTRTPFIYPMHLNKVVQFTGKTANFINYTHLLTITHNAGVFGNLVFREKMMAVTRVYTAGAGVALTDHLCDLGETTGFFYLALPLAYYTIQQLDCLVNLRLNYRWAVKPNDFKKMLATYKEQMKSIVTKYVRVKMFKNYNCSLLQTICKSTADDTDPISKDFEVFLHECCRWEKADKDAYAHPSIFFRTLGVCSLQSAIDFACETQSSQNKTYTTLLSSYPIGTQIVIQQCMKKLAGNAAYAYLNREEAPTSIRTGNEQGDSDDDESVVATVVRMLKNGGKELNKKATNSVWDVSINSIASVTVNPGGAAYTDAPTVTIGAPPAKHVCAAVTATATAAVHAGAVSRITVVGPGSGYVDAPAINIIRTNGGQGAVATALLCKIGSLLRIHVSNTGRGYRVAPTVTFEGGEGKDAEAFAVIRNGTVVGIEITDAGSGYTSSPQVKIVAENGEGSDAVATAFVIEETAIGISLAATFMSSFKEWSVSNIVIPARDPSDDVRELLIAKFHDMDAGGAGDGVATRLTFDSSIAMSWYETAYRLEISQLGVPSQWYFKPVYPVQVQHENEHNTIDEKVGDCVYAKFDNATLCFKLKQTHAINALASGALNGVSNFWGSVGRFTGFFGANYAYDDGADDDGNSSSSSDG